MRARQRSTDALRSSAWFRKFKGWQTFKVACARWAEVDGGQRSAAFAFYLLLSLFPLIVMLVTVGSLLVERDVATQKVVQLVRNYAPLTGEQEGAAVTQIRGVMEARGTVSLVALPLLIWGRCVSCAP